jgi:hypothetical protein
MGNWFSKNEANKINENEGQITNNVVIDDTVDVHNFEIILMLFIITILKIIEFACFTYKTHKNSLKKKYMKNKINLNNHSTV